MKCNQRHEVPQDCFEQDLCVVWPQVPNTLILSSVQEFMFLVKTQTTIFHNLNSFSLKPMYNVALVEYLTVSVIILLLQLPK